MKQYEVIRNANGIEPLEKDVCRKIGQGYVPIGGVQVVSLEGKMWYLQAIYFQKKS